MSVEITIRGSAELRKVAAQLRAEHKALQKHVNDGTRKATKPLERAIKASAAVKMPSGYAPTFVASLQVTTITRAAGVRMRILARGRGALRDAQARERGSLRHPVYGRWTRLAGGRVRDNPWVNQRIPPGFVSGPARELAGDVYRELENVAEDVRRRIERG